MFAIFKRELRSYFTSLVGYVVIGVMLAFTGLYYSANCLVYGTSDFQPFCILPRWSCCFCCRR